MQKRQLLIIWGAFLCGGLLVSQTLPSTVPLAAREHQPRGRVEPQGFGWVFDLKGKKYEAKITRDQIAAGPEWTPSVPVPLTFATVEKIAREELRKLVSDDSTWEVTELNLHRLSEQPGSKWYYVIKLMPKARDANVISDLFLMPISFSGAIGRVQVYGP